MKLRELFQRIRKWIYGKNYTCYLCRAEVFDGQSFCDTCRKFLPYNTNFCARCGRKIAQSGYCMDCRSHAPQFDKARSLFVYEGEVKNLIYAFKNGNSDFSEGLATELAPLIESEFSDADCITFVPMTKSAERERGYNQAEILAKELATQTGLPVEALFEKTKDTPEQKSLNRVERQKNLHGAFHLKKRAVCKGKTVLIVDDLLTTGATAEELSRLLYGAKAKKVYLLTVASVVLQKEKNKRP